MGVRLWAVDILISLWAWLLIMNVNFGFRIHIRRHKIFSGGV